MKRFFITLLVLVGFIVPTTSFAQVDMQKVYSYDAIATNITVNQDSTFSVVERQVFNYQSGIFHQGLRVIPLSKVSRIDGVFVSDGENGRSLQYSPRRLDKTDSNNWGKYTYYTTGGNLNIEWYYNLSNTKHQWVLHYTVHGGLEFYKENDRLYWNITSGYDVPVGNAAVRVFFPKGIDFSQLKLAAYRTTSQPIGNHIQSPDWVDFQTFAVAPGEAFTIDIAFPKGIVQESAFWREWIAANYGYAGSAAIILLTALFLVAYRYYTERYKKGRGVIIAQYEPPQNLHPAMAEVVIKETITNKAWPATIVDLAVRGYVKVGEEDPGFAAKAGGVITVVFFAVVFGLIGFGLFMAPIPPSALAVFGFLFIVAGTVFSKSLGGIDNVKRWFVPKSYRIEKVKEYAEDPNVEEYEKKFLDIIFSGIDLTTKGSKNYFSLKEIKESPSSQRELARLLDELKQDLYEETDKDTKAFENGMSKSKYFGYVLSVLLGIAFIALRINMIDFTNQFVVLMVVSGVVVIFSVAFVLFEPRLSQEGHLLKEDWLGFKLYLETAEKYRLQNLTPDLFEKYLPYAMIFGIEKKWAKSFETMTMQPPTWYGVGAVGVTATVSNVVSFSPVTFSSSFSSSFASAFASSGGGGGGGGSAGGGGGGGGGGAS